MTKSISRFVFTLFIELEKLSEIENQLESKILNFISRRQRHEKDADGKKSKMNLGNSKKTGVA